jgi:hypothetical protein
MHHAHRQAEVMNQVARTNHVHCGRWMATITDCLFKDNEARGDSGNGGDGANSSPWAQTPAAKSRSLHVK